MTAPLVQDAQSLRIAPFGGVQEIAEEDQSSRRFAVDNRVEASERSAGGSARHGHAKGAESGGLAEMRIGDEERPAGVPPDRPLGQQRQVLAGDSDDGLVHPAAFSSESCIRRMRSLSDSDDTLSRFRSTTRGNPI